MLYKRAKESGEFVVDVNLAGVVQSLRSLGQYGGRLKLNARTLLEMRTLGSKLEEFVAV